MRHNRILTALALLLLALGISQNASGQASGGGTLAYGDDVSNVFESDGTQSWTFDGLAREQISLEVRRISGVFLPRIQLEAPDGSFITPDVDQPDSTGQLLRFTGGLPADGSYTIVVEGSGVQSDVDNPDEYVLSLRRIGERKADPQAGLTIPQTGLDPAQLPTLESGTPATRDDDRFRLEPLQFFGNVQVVRPEPAARPAYYRVTGSGYTIEEMFTGNNISRVLRSIEMTNDGIGLVGNDGQFFFTDQDITFLENDNSSITVTLDDGSIINTDFFNQQTVLAVEGRVVVLTPSGQRLLFQGDNYAFRVEDEPIVRFTVDEGSLTTDFDGWDTLAYLPQNGARQLAVLYGPDLRLLSDTFSLDLQQRDIDFAALDAEDAEAEAAGEPLDRDGTERVEYLEITVIAAGTEVALTVDPFGMGDIVIQGGQLSLRPLDERVLDEPLAALSGVLVEDTAALFTRLDETSRLALPDGTEIETPAPSFPDDNALPGEPGYSPRSFNRLGTGAMPTCPCVTTVAEDSPVNPVTGNFAYAVTDFEVPSHSFGLAYTRHYNSRADDLTPPYMRQSPTPYPFSAVGGGWRHSYQVDLDLRQAPNGSVTLILPDGAAHIFSRVDETSNRFLSISARQWMIERQRGLTGDWIATSTGGMRYFFDRAGRLQRMVDADGLALDFTPVPLDYRDAGGGGFFVIEPYGRRLEIYADETGFIQRVRNTDRFETSYTVNASGELTNVDYVAVDQAAEYAYEGGTLARLSDPRSPYQPEMALRYDLRNRVQAIVHDPDGLARTFDYAYDDESLPRLVTRSTTVSGVLRVESWQVDPRGRVLQHDLPLDGWQEQFEYDNDGDLPTGYRYPEGVRVRFRVNAQGNITAIVDPVYTNSGETVFTYETFADGHQQRLTEITYPNGGYERFEYDPEHPHRVIVWRRQIEGGQAQLERVTRTEYDDLGRVSVIAEPGPDPESEILTRYSYDAFGYVSEIVRGEGVGLLDESLVQTRRNRFVYDRIGRLRSVEDGRGKLTTLTWDNERGLVTTISAPADHVVRYDYDSNNRLIRVDDRGAIVEYTYNGLGHVITVTDPIGRLTEYERDEAGNITRLLLPDPEGRTEMTFTYDVMDHLTSATSPLGRVTRYNEIIEVEAGIRRRTVTDPIGQRVESTYNAIGRLVSLREFDRNNRQVRFYDLSYDVMGNITAVSEVHVPSGRTLEMQYNRLGQMTENDIDGVGTRYTYDRAGNLAAVTRPDDTRISYTYDTLGQVVAITLPEEPNIGIPVRRYRYDEVGNLIASVAPDGTETTYVYDDLDRLTAIIDPLDRQTSFDYDLRSNLVTITDPLGNTRQAEYDDLDRLVRLVDGVGESTNYSYDILGRLQEISAPRGLDTTFTYDLEDNVVALAQPSNINALFGYDALNRITSNTDSLGRTTIYDYNRQGRLSRVVGPFGGDTSYIWSSSGRLSSVIDEADREYIYNTEEGVALGRLDGIRDVTTDATIAIRNRYLYDDLGRILTVRYGTDQTINNESRGVWHRYSYTPNGYLASYTDPEGGTWAFTYDLNGQPVQVIDPKGTATLYEYDAAGQITAMIHAAGTEAEAIESFVYDDAGQIIAYTDPLGIVTTFTYDAVGHVTQRTENPGPDQRVTLYEYDALGFLTSVIDPTGLQTEYRYDVFGRLQSMTQTLQPDEEDGEPVDIRYRFEYDEASNLTSIALPQETEDEEQNVNMTYNALDRRVRFVDNEDLVWSYTYDVLGNLTQISDPLGSATGYVYDSMSRVTEIVYANGTRVAFTYDSADNLNQVTGAETEIRSNPGAFNESTNFQRATITYEMDRMGRLRAIADVDGSRTEYSYDESGRVVSRRDAEGRTTNYSYDASGRLVQTTYPDGSSIFRTYDADGRLLTVSSPAGEYGFSYNAFDEVVSSIAPGLNVERSYDAAGNLTQTDRGEFGTVLYTYDNLHRLVRIDYGDEWVIFRYDRNGWRTEVERSNGVITFYAYDKNGRPETIDHFGAEGATLDSYVYRYNDVGSIIRVDRLVQDAEGQLEASSVLFSYDVTHQLIDERWLDVDNRTRYAINVRYDDTGNRVETFISSEGSSTSRTLFVYDRENQLIEQIRNYVPPETTANPAAVALILFSSGGGLWLARRRRRLAPVLAALPLLLVGLLGVVPLQQDEDPSYRIDYSYDRNGNLLRVQHPDETGIALDYRYDAENRLVGVSGINEAGAVVNTRYTYDPFNRLAEVRTEETAYRLYYDRETLIAVRDVNTGDTWRRIEGQPGEILLNISPDGSVTWPINDVLNNPRRTAQADGTGPAEAGFGLNFNAFGQVIEPFGPGLTPSQGSQPSAGFTGEIYDPSTGLYLIGMRAYDPALGRFIQRDPVRHDPFGSLYIYAYNQPNRFIDPTGMVPESALTATTVVNLAEAARPDAIPEPLLPDIPQTEPVEDLQATELFRVMDLGLNVRASLNETIAQIDPMARDFYVYRTNPAAPAINQLGQQHALDALNVFRSGEDWSHLAAPMPTTVPDAFRILDIVDPLLLAADGFDTNWCEAAPARALSLPQLPDLTPLSPAQEAEAALRSRFYEVPLFMGVIPTDTAANEPEMLFPAPSVPQPMVDVPEVIVQPAVTARLNHLRDQMRAFAEMSLMLVGSLP